MTTASPLNIARLTAPDNALGRFLLRTRMWLEILPHLAAAQTDPKLHAVIELARHLVPVHTMLSVPRMRSLYERILELRARGIPGDVVECGVWNGGGSAIMAAAMATSGQWRNMWLFDSFEGLPPPTSEDPAEVHAGYHKGWCLGRPDLARKAVLEQGLPENRLHLVKGWFADSFPTVDIPTIALLHIDADWYAPVKLCLETFYDAVAPGGVIVLDDYGRWAGCKQATDEFRVARGITAPLHRIDASGQYFVKP